MTHPEADDIETRSTFENTLSISNCFLSLSLTLVGASKTGFSRTLRSAKLRYDDVIKLFFIDIKLGVLLLLLDKALLTPDDGAPRLERVDVPPCRLVFLGDESSKLSQLFILIRFFVDERLNDERSIVEPKM